MTQEIKNLVQHNSQNMLITLPASMDELELSEDELKKAIDDAKAVKYFQLKEQYERQEKNRIAQDCFRPWSVEEMKQNAIQSLEKKVEITGKKLELDTICEASLDLLSQYFTNHPAFEKEGYSLQKGILLIGSVGVGKTALMKAFAKNKKRCFYPVSANQVVSDVQRTDLARWQAYTGFVPGHGNTLEYLLQSNIGWMIDDVATEEVYKEFGNTIDIIEKIISQRYMLADRIPFDSMHLTTNLSEEMLSKRYGPRFMSRLYDMFNIIIINGKDRRRE